MRRSYVPILLSIGAIALSLGGYVALQRYYQRPLTPLATVAFLDVGQGDAIFIEAENGAQMLVDAGAGSDVLRELPKVMGVFDRTIDLVLVTHPDADHVGGMGAVLRRYAVAATLATEQAADTPSYDAFRDAVYAEHSARANMRQGSIIRLADSVSFEVLYPQGAMDGLATNDGSIVGMLHAGQIDFLLMGDASQWVERELVKQYGPKLRSAVLKVGHHGSKTSTAPEFVEMTAPAVAIISAGADNRYGHPHEQTLATLAHFAVPVLSTMEEGTIVLATDGKRVWRK